jgi:hypothetical protein
VNSTQIIEQNTAFRVRFASFAQAVANLSQAMANAETAIVARRGVALLEANVGLFFSDSEIAAGDALREKQVARAKERAEEKMRRVGPALWEKWHRRAILEDGEIVDTREERQWIEREILAKLPCGDCRAHAAELVERVFPPGVWPADYFAAIVAIHNAVNRRLDKPEMTLAAALNHWRVQTSGVAAPAQ